MNGYTEFLTMLSSEFHRYFMEHEHVASTIPRNAVVIFQVHGEEEFNKWHRAMSLRNRETTQPVIHVHVNKLRYHSLLEDVAIEKIAA